MNTVDWSPISVLYLEVVSFNVQRFHCPIRPHKQNSLFLRPACIDFCWPIKYILYDVILYHVNKDSAKQKHDRCSEPIQLSIIDSIKKSFIMM